MLQVDCTLVGKPKKQHAKENMEFQHMSLRLPIQTMQQQSVSKGSVGPGPAATGASVPIRPALDEERPRICLCVTHRLVFCFIFFPGTKNRDRESAATPLPSYSSKTKT